MQSANSIMESPGVIALAPPDDISVQTGAVVAGALTVTVTVRGVAVAVALLPVTL